MLDIKEAQQLEQKTCTPDGEVSKAHSSFLTCFVSPNMAAPSTGPGANNKLNSIQIIIPIKMPVMDKNHFERTFSHGTKYIDSVARQRH